jgi:hypothetical protein
MATGIPSHSCAGLMVLPRTDAHRMGDRDEALGSA